MKKIYTSVLVFFALIMLTPAVKAQLACPGPNPPAVFNESWIDPVSGNQVCALYVYNMWPNGRVRVSGPGGVLILPVSGETLVTTDANGYVCYVYACSENPLQVSVCNGVNCCVAPVPARSLLPVKLTGFNTRIGAGQAIELNWSSSVEQESLKYIIERSSDGKNFRQVGEVNAAGNSSSTIRYSFTDNSNTSPIAFYRLKQVDVDGKYIYSKVVYANNSKAGNGKVVKIFPNPFHSDIQLIGITANDLSNGKLRVFSSTGKRVNFTISGTNAITIDESAPSGIYILQVNEQRFKLIKN